MSIRVRRSIDVWCDVVRRSELSKAHKVVAWALSSHMDNTTLETWPSLDLLAEEANVARSTVQAAIKQLKESDLLAVTPGKKHREPDGTWRQEGNRYHGVIPPGTEHRVPKAGYRGNRYVTFTRTLNRTLDDRVLGEVREAPLEAAQSSPPPTTSSLHVGDTFGAERWLDYEPPWNEALDAYELKDGSLVRLVEGEWTVVQVPMVARG